MQRYLALLRGINVGGKNVIAMKDLSTLLAGLGYIDITTYIQSGNVVFSADGKADDIATAIHEALVKRQGIDAAVLVFDAEGFTKALADSPYDIIDGKAVHLFFLDQPAEAPNLQRLEELQLDSEQFRLIGKVFYLYTPDGIGRSKLAANVEKCLGVAVTARNGNTVAKLQSLLDKE